jgi:hypothetical protein
LIAAGREHLTPAADIYSLAKTAYALVAGESPRRFAQHSIKDMPPTMTSECWAAPVLRVLQKATQTRPADRYQTVQDFWDELADAALPATRPLPGGLENPALHRRPSSDLSIEPEEFTAAPPQPRFQMVKTLAPDESPEKMPERPYADASSSRRPKIVVPVSTVDSKRGPLPERASAKERLAALPDESRKPKAGARPGTRREVGPRRARPYLVAAILVLLFSGMLLATHKYVTSHWNPFVGLPLLSEVFVIGREGVTTTDVNLRAEANVLNAPIGLAEGGSRVKILSTAEFWYEVQVLEHGRPKTDPFTSDRGWINKKFVKFD